MALKQVAARQALQQAGCEIIETSLCEIPNGWMAIVNTAEGKRLATAIKGENPLRRRQAVLSQSFKGVDVELMELNAVNAAEVRHTVKWTSPIPCGVKGTSVGFCDYLQLGAGFLAPFFAKKQLRPVLVDISPEVSAAWGFGLLEAMNAVTWSIAEQGAREGFGASAAELQIDPKAFAGFNFEEDIYKALGGGYKTIGLSCADKVDCSLEQLTDEQVEKRFEELNEVFRAALDASYLKVEFQVGSSKLSFQPAGLHRIVLEYGEAIMHIQNVYNTFLKSAPWEIDFEIAMSVPGKCLTPQEHYFLANEMQRNGIKLAAVCVDAVNEGVAFTEELQQHADIADTFGYRLSIKNADIALEDLAKVMKATKGKVHFKANNLLWLSAVQYIAESNADLYTAMLQSLGLDATAVKDGDYTAFAAGYGKMLQANVELGTNIRSYIQANKDKYVEVVQQNLQKTIINRL